MTTGWSSRERWTSSSMASAPSAMARSKAAMVFSGAAAEAPRWAITSGGALIVPFRASVAVAGREDAGPGRGSPGHVGLGADVLRYPLRGNRAYPARGPAAHHAQPRDLRRPSAGEHSHPAPHPLHGLGPALRHSGLRLADPATARLPGGYRVRGSPGHAGGGEAAR